MWRTSPDVVVLLVLLDRTSCAFGSTSCLTNQSLGSKFGSCLTLNFLLFRPSLNARPHFNYTSFRFLCAHGWAQKEKQELRQDAAILAKQLDQRTRTVRKKAQDVQAITGLTTPHSPAGMCHNVARYDSSDLFIAAATTALELFWVAKTSPTRF